MTSANLAVLNLGNGFAGMQIRARIVTLSDATNTYTWRAGFLDSNTAESTDGVFFRYTHSVNGGRYQAVTRNNSVETATDTGVAAAANVWDRFEIAVDPVAPFATFFIDDVRVAEQATNIPLLTGRETSYGKMTLRSVGTAAINSDDIDYMSVFQFLAVRR
jgi:hypothetical protein